ncbi:replication restart DNA helicase PriA [Alkalinema sp. FACHB-956]|uniref:replication restart DNA helicase PriA n=1 Tax=Alkalinema sp. FACHB-956 TaxID=2692768 RepID=UPI0016864116|nr:replication restart DNA helicase PriA [Alkalinema sp. FACHB-956]MBD2326860.1 replication restart DNA helicase PriA [Alkalinema sp. FACHB-956]
MPLTYSMPCPNCGHSAERLLTADGKLIRTQCSACDYLLITCRTTGKVIEAYAPGISMQALSPQVLAPLPDRTVPAR